MKRGFIFVALFVAGCGGITISRGRLQPIEAIAAASPPKPCVGEVPERAKFGTLDGPDPVEGVDEQGNPISGIRFVVTSDSAIKVFHYIEKLEEIAKRARESCVAAPAAPSSAVAP